MLQSLRDAKVDDTKWEAAYAYVQAYEAWQKAGKAYGFWHPLADEKLNECIVAMRRYNRMARK